MRAHAHLGGSHHSSPSRLASRVVKTSTVHRERTRERETCGARGGARLVKTDALPREEVTSEIVLALTSS